MDSLDFSKYPDLSAGISGSDWRVILAECERHRHRATMVEGGCVAHNPGQQWRTDFDGRGFLVTPVRGTWEWGLDVQGYGVGNSRHEIGATARLTIEGGRVTYEWDPFLDEWFINDSRGLEHGFTIRKRPEPGFRDSSPRGGDGGETNGDRLHIDLAVRGSLSPAVSADGRNVEFLDPNGAAVLTYSGLVVFDADGKSLPSDFHAVSEYRMSSEASAFLSEPGPVSWRIRINIDDRDARYPLTVDPIAQQAYLKGAASEAGDNFGFSVAASGNTVVVGAWLEDGGSTGVNGNQGDNSAENSGAAYVFVRNGATWSQQAYLKASNTGSEDYFGSSVAVDGDTIVVGAYEEDGGFTGVNGNQADNTARNSGAAYVFVRNGTTWTQQAYLKASNTGVEDYFGISVAVSGDLVVVGAHGEDSSSTDVNGDQINNGAQSAGAAYIFVRNGTNWSQQAYLKASNCESDDSFGIAVGTSGDTVVIGAQAEDSAATGINGVQSDNSAESSGAGYIFVRNGTAWTQQAYVKASNTGMGDFFGRSVAIFANAAVFGAPEEDSSATGVNGNQGDELAENAGAAYVFVRSGTSWSQQAYLKASNTDPSDRFGVSVAIDGNRLLAGAPEEDSIAMGVDGDQDDENAPNAGAAYLFARIGSTWTQEAYLKASNAETADRFGWSVALAAELSVIGSPLESSATTGINGNQNDNNAFGSGAAYLLELPIIQSPLQLWRQQHFGTSDDSGIAANAADPDEDGLVNVIEFALGTNPTAPNGPPVQLSLAGQNLELTFPRNKASHAEVTLVVEWSATLAPGSWSSAGVVESILSDDGTIELVKGTLPAAGLRQFIRFSGAEANL